MDPLPRNDPSARATVAYLREGNEEAPVNLDAEGAPAGLVRAPARPLATDAEGERPTWPALRRGFLRRCPHCGEGRLFDGYLKVVDSCPACGEALRHHRADDGPAYLTILVVGHVLAVAMHVIWVRFRPEPMVFATLLTVLAVGLSLWLLPRFKGAVVGYQWAHRMHGFGASPN